ncbi:MAG: hypothetical protein V3W37_02280 [Candidatus Binatia bacterium]
MLDGILFERKGVPSASIVTEPFVSTGRAMAEAWGVRDYRFLAMPHPTANLTEEELDQRAREIVPQVVELLLDKSLATKEALLSGGSGG